MNPGFCPRPAAALGAALFAALFAALPAAAQAQAPYPAQPVKILVSSSAGGSPDIQLRLVAQKISEARGTVFVIENLPGASGNIAAERVAHAAPDGYTLLYSSAGPIFFNKSLFRKLNYDIERDFEAISQFASTPNILAVHPSQPFRTVQELVAFAKAHPGRLRYGSAGSGSSQHLSMELFKSLAGVDIAHIPYKASSQMTTELVAGQIELAFQNAPLILPHVRSGRLRALAVSTAVRQAFAPEMPTVAESGLAGYEAGGGSGLLAPRGTPRAVVDRLYEDVSRALALPAVREQYAKNGLHPVASSPAEFAAHIKSEIARWAPVIRATGATVD